MSVQANWNLAGLVLPDEGRDPVQDIMAIAKPIDLSKSIPELSAELQRLAAREGWIFEKSGVECELKWQKDHSCYACPYYEGDNTASDKMKPMLCRLGREQEDKLAEMDQRRAVEETAAVIELAILHDECAELADLSLPLAV